MTKLDEHLLHYKGQSPNFAPIPPISFTGWKQRDRSIQLGMEPSGAPVAGGIWEKACQILTDYTFIDPRIMTAYFDKHDPLLGRTMVLVGHFLFMNVYFGARIHHITDELREGRYHVWGFSYVTLKGHFEAGELAYEISKDTQTGEVRFRMKAYVRLGTIRNPVYWVGFRMVSPILSEHFYRFALVQMCNLTTK